MEMGLGSWGLGLGLGPDFPPRVGQGRANSWWGSQTDKPVRNAKSVK